MATYFKFDKKLPHINYDDIYVKSGKIENGKLVLSYSNEALDPIAIDLSAFNNFAYFDSVKLEGNSLIFSYFEKSGKYPVSVDLSAFDHYIDSIAMSDDKTSLSLSYNNGSFLTADTSEWSKHAEDIELDDNVLCISFNDKSSMSADLSKYDRKMQSVNADNDILTITDSKGDEISTSLARYSVDHRVIDAKLLHDGRTLVLLMNGLPDISVDTTLLALNDFISQGHLDNETLVLDYNTSKQALSIELSSLNTYVDSVDVEDGKLVLKYANGRHAPISTDVNQFIQNWHLSGASFDEDSNVLSLLMNTDQVPSMRVNLSSLAKDTYIKDISTNLQNDIVTFIYNDKNVAGNVSLQKYRNDSNLQNVHGVHDRALQFVKGDGSFFNVSLSSAKSLSINDNVLSLEFNDGKRSLTTDLSHLDRKLTSATVDSDSNLLIADNFDNVVSTALPIHDTYISSAAVIDNSLVLAYNDDNLPKLSTSLSSIIKDDTVVTSAYINQDILEISSSNGKTIAVNLAKYNQFVTAFDFNELKNELSIVKSNGVNIAVSLDTLDKNISSVTADDGKLVMKYNNGKGTLTADLSKYDCYVDGLAFNTNTNVLSVRNSNKNVANDLTTCLSSLDRYNVSASIDNNNILKITDSASSEVSVKLPIHDTYISAIGIDENSDTMTFDYNVADISAKSVNLRTYRQNDWIESGLYDADSKQLVLKYHNDEKFDIRPSDVSIDLQIGTSGGFSEKTIKGWISTEVSNETVRATNVEFGLQNSINKLSNIFIFDEDGDVVAFKMKDSTVPDLNWKVSIESGQLTISEHVEFLTADNIYADNAYVNRLSVD